MMHAHAVAAAAALLALTLQGVDVAHSFGPNPREGDAQCVSTLGQYCDPGTRQCVAPVLPAYLPGVPFPGGIGEFCLPAATPGSKKDFCKNKNAIQNEFCSNFTRRCTVPAGFGPGSSVGAPCKSRCLDPKAYCSYFFKACVVPADPTPASKLPTECTGFGTRGNCPAGQKCSPLLAQCVTIGLPCVTENHLYFSWINKTESRCGDVDAAPRMGEQIFQPNNTQFLLAYILSTENNYPTPTSPRPQDPYLQQMTCASQGYTKPAGSTVAPWVSQRWMKSVCAGCNCE